MTIKELAEIAGVSPSTVSNVLNGRGHKMKKETLAHVKKVIEDTKYVSNMGGRLLANYGSRIIGVIVTYARRDEMNMVQSPFFSEIIGALENEIRHNGYFMMIYTSANVEESLRMAASWNIEGLIVLGSLADDCAQFMKNTNIPLVFIDSYFHEDGLRYINVGLEDRLGSYKMTEYLILQGHKRIAFLADGNPPMGVDEERMAGYREALQAHSLVFRQEDYIFISHHAGQRHQFFDSFAAEAVKKYTALFFASDFYAVDAINIFYDNGIAIPRDISVCGFDDNIFADQSRPRLTTVRQNVSDKAVCAVKQLLKVIRRETLEQDIIRLKTTITIRESVAVPTEPLA